MNAALWSCWAAQHCVAGGYVYQSHYATTNPLCRQRALAGGGSVDWVALRPSAVNAEE